jgi:hypothetical protein
MARPHPAPGVDKSADFESGYPYKRDQFISVAGASWAVIALTRALTAVANSAPLPLEDAAPPAVEPWVETAMFGTVGDLEQLLKTGLSPNATTQAGGIPLLSLVVPDVDKVRVLVAAGADVNARSQIGFSPLLVASQYLEANPAIRLLLKLELKTDLGAPFDISPDGTHVAFIATADEGQPSVYLRDLAGAEPVRHGGDDVGAIT